MKTIKVFRGGATVIDRGSRLQVQIDGKDPIKEVKYNSKNRKKYLKESDIINKKEEITSR